MRNKTFQLAVPLLDNNVMARVSLMEINPVGCGAISFSGDATDVTQGLELFLELLAHL